MTSALSGCRFDALIDASVAGMEHNGVAIRGYETSAVFSRSFLRSAKILMQNGAILRNTLRILNR
jgi:hypothetical protein